MKARQALVRSFLVVAAVLSAVSMSAAASAQGASLKDATAAQKKAAGEAYGKGTEAFDREDYESALVHFRESYDTVASPNSHLMIARTLHRMGRTGQAYAEIQQTVTEAQAAAKKERRYRDTLKAAEDVLRDIEQQIGTLTIRLRDVDEGAVVIVEQREVPATGLSEPVRVGSGEVVVVLRLADGREVRETVTVPAGGSSEVELAPPPPPAPPEPEPEPRESELEVSGSSLDKRTLAYVAGGVGAAGVLTFGIFGLMSRSNYSDLEEGCTNTSCPPHLVDARDSGRTQQTVANVGLAVGVIGLGTGAVLYYLSGREKAQTARYPSISIGVDSVSISGSF
jgi:hypothetical protein